MSSSLNIPRHATLHSGVITATGAGEIKSHGGPNVVVVLDITAVSGTAPTLDVLIEEYDPASGTYFTIDTFPQQVGVAKVRRTVTGPHGPFIRASWTLGGTATPTVTCTIGMMSG
jgi:hypothetical protein